MKKASVIFLIIGGTLLLCGIALPIIVSYIYTAMYGSIGIIGGADSPTAVFITLRIVGNFPLVMKLIGGAITLSSLFCLIFHKTVGDNCTLKTSGIALGLSATASVGVYSWLLMLLSNPRNNPIEFPVSVFLLIICFVVFLVLLYLYIKYRKTKPSVKGVIIDVAFALLFIIPFFFAFAMLHNLIA